MTTEKAYRLENSAGCRVSGIFTEKELKRFAEAGWAVVEEQDPADYRIGRDLQ
jgi:hypothetical protein